MNPKTPRAFEADHDVTAATGHDAFRDAAGELQETSKFFEISALFALRGLTE